MLDTSSVLHLHGTNSQHTGCPTQQVISNIQISGSLEVVCYTLCAQTDINTHASIRLSIYSQTKVTSAPVKGLGCSKVKEQCTHLPKNFVLQMTVKNERERNEDWLRFSLPFFFLLHF